MGRLMRLRYNSNVAAARQRGNLGSAVWSGLFALACALGVWELVARTLIQLQPVRVPVKTGGQAYDGRLVQSEEGYCVTHFHKSGFRDPVPKGRHKFTVLTLGDSFTEAVQVNDDQTFPSKTQALLQAQGIDVGIYNAGTSGGSPPRYISLASIYNQTLHPDPVVICLNTSDYTADYLDRAHTFTAEKEGLGYKLVILPNSGKQRLTKMPVVSQVIRTSLFQMAAKKMTVGGSGGGEAESKPAKKSVGDEELTRYVRWTLEQYKAAYPHLTLVFVPGIDYFKFTTEGQHDEYILVAQCKELGVTLINMRTIYQDQYRQDGVPSHGFNNTSPGKGHINAHGHALLAEELSNELARSLRKT